MTTEQLSGLQIGGHQALNFAYNPLGLEQSRQTEQGFNLLHDWDDRGRLQAQLLGGNQPYAKSQTLRNYHYDNLVQLIGIDDPYWGDQQFTHPSNGQINEVRRQDRNDN